MARPRGSKSRKSEQFIGSSIEIEERMREVEEELDDLSASLKAKKAELKELAKAKIIAEKEELAAKAEEDKEKIMEAVAASGKSVEEILELLGNP